MRFAFTVFAAGVVATSSPAGAAATILTLYDNTPTLLGGVVEMGTPNYRPGKNVRLLSFDYTAIIDGRMSIGYFFWQPQPGETVQAAQTYHFEPNLAVWNWDYGYWVLGIWQLATPNPAIPDAWVPVSGYYSNIVISMEDGYAAVPEPATWAMMIGGFGLAGAAMRRRVKVKVAWV